MHLVELKEDWQLRQEELSCGPGRHAAVAAQTDGWFDVPSLPCDIHVPLIEAGLIEEPLVSDNFTRCRWIEDKSWWFRKVFQAGPALREARRCELVVEGLDVKADLFLNGEHLGHHPSAMYPFRRDVRDLLRNGENTLLVRVTSGLEYYSDRDVAAIKDWIACEYKRGRGPRGDNRRVMVRKPQYVFGWDWVPRIASCGIMGGARIEAYHDIAVRDVKFTTRRLAEEQADGSVEVEIEHLQPIATTDLIVRVELRFDGAVAVAAEEEVFARSGLNFVTLDLTVPHPRLWWPNGMGAQELYVISVTARAASGAADTREVTCGIRTIALDTSKLDAANRLFAFVVNGVRVFCKGADWETPDAIYGRIADATYEHLVGEAREAHFNMFRVNGCNAYERDYFYECCDRHGILVWQDFIGFTCAAYPDELDWFRTEVERELDYQTRRLRNHPCLALLCGNNECHGHLASYHPGGYWAGNRKPTSPGGTVIYNEIMPRIVRRNCPQIPYWNSSPYGGAADPESNDCGDRHHWIFMSRDMEERITPEEYDKIACKFVSEFGCIGPTKKSSLARYCGRAGLERDSEIWRIHTNTFEKGVLDAAIRKHYADPEGLPLDDYLLYAGLFQGVTLGYAIESMRRAENNYGALIWSFNDAWGEIGWSIIDYYDVRKISYPFVKRAFEPVKLMLREHDDEIIVTCLNDSRETLRFGIECGYMTFGGEKADVQLERVTVAPRTQAVVVARIEKRSHDMRNGLYYAWPNTEIGMRPAILRPVRFRNLRNPPAVIQVSDWRVEGAAAQFNVSSATYAHAVHFGLPDDMALSDEYFDLLPGETRCITVCRGHAASGRNDVLPRAVNVHR